MNTQSVHMLFTRKPAGHHCQVQAYGTTSFAQHPTAESTAAGASAGTPHSQHVQETASSLPCQWYRKAMIADCASAAHYLAAERIGGGNHKVCDNQLQPLQPAEQQQQQQQQQVNSKPKQQRTLS
jgi:hypothetical protein